VGTSSSTWPGLTRVPNAVSWQWRIAPQRRAGVPLHINPGRPDGRPRSLPILRRSRLAGLARTARSAEPDDRVKATSPGPLPRPRTGRLRPIVPAPHCTRVKPQLSGTSAQGQLAASPGRCRCPSPVSLTRGRDRTRKRRTGDGRSLQYACPARHARLEPHVQPAREPRQIAAKISCHLPPKVTGGHLTESPRRAIQRIVPEWGTQPRLGTPCGVQLLRQRAELGRGAWHVDQHGMIGRCVSTRDLPDVLPNPGLVRAPGPQQRR
jgi:hypothetical protein